MIEREEIAAIMAAKRDRTEQPTKLLDVSRAGDPAEAVASRPEPTTD